MFWSPAQSRRASAVDLLALLVFGLLVLVVFLDSPQDFPGPQSRLNLGWHMLPVYGLFSLLRMLVAYARSLVFAFVVGRPDRRTAGPPGCRRPQVSRLGGG